MGGYSTRSAEDVLYGSNYGIVANGTTDDTAAFNTFMAACKAGSKKGELPAGIIRFASKPNAIDFSWHLSGKGLVTTVISRDYNEGFEEKGCLELVIGAAGSLIENLSIRSPAGRTGGSFISAIYDATSNFIDGVLLRNLWLTTLGTDTHNYNVYIDGSLRASNLGAREWAFDNVYGFGAKFFSMYIKSVKAFSWSKGGTYLAGGSSVASGGIKITGTSSVKSQYVNILLPSCAGFNLDYLTEATLNVAGIGAMPAISVYNTANCDNIQVIGNPGGTIQGNWVSSGVRRPSAAFSTT